VHSGLWKEALGHQGRGRVMTAARWAVARDRDFTETALPSVGDASDPTERAVRLIGGVEMSSSTVQDALGAASSRGAATPASLVGAIGASAIARSAIQAVEDDVDAATLWTHRTRPQGFGNLAKNTRFPQRPHRLPLPLKEKERRTESLISAVGRIGSAPRT